MDKLQGTRADDAEAVMKGPEGGYFPMLDAAGEVTALWFKLPSGSIGRIAAKGHGSGDEPEWTIDVEPDGTVTVDPSIKQHEITYEAGHPTIPYWHGHLRAGKWESA